MKATLQAAQIAALKALNPPLANGTRMHIVGRVIVITLSGADLKHGVPDAPPDEDINAAIRCLIAMKSTVAKARQESLTKIAI